eukprot:COSAG03_NODE_337_length_8860_cov_33.996690_2_plen_816_part_00
MAISTSAAVDAIVLSENLLLGNRDVHSIEEYEQHGGTMPCDYGGFNSFCEALKPTSIKHLDLSKCRLDASATSGLADAFKFMGALNSVVLDENELTGTKIKYKGTRDERIERLDADLSGFTEFCSSLKSSTIVSLSLRKCYLGPQAVVLLADAIKVIATVNLLTLDSTGNMRYQKTYTLTAGEEKIDLSQKNLGSADAALLTSWLQRPEVTAAVDAVAIGGNPITSAGGATLLETIKTSKLKTIDIGNPLPVQEPYESDTLGLSSTGMDPGHILILSWWLATDAAAAVDNIDLSGCGLAGATKTKYIGDGKCTWENIDSSMDGFIALCAVIGKVHTIRLADCGLGPRSTAELSKVFTNADATIARLTIDSTGVPNKIGGSRIEREASGPRTYTLTVGKEEIDLSKKNLGSADVALVASWLQRPEVSAAVDAVAIGGNPITSAGGATLLETIKTSKLKTIDIGKPLPLQEPYESDTLDLSKTGMDPGHIVILSWWLATDAAGAVSSVVISNNFIFGSNNKASYDSTQVHDVDKDQSGWNNLCEQLKVSKITSFTAADIGMGPVALRTLATSLPGAIARLVLNGNTVTNYGKNLSGLTALCDVLPALKNPISLELANCNLKVAEVNELARAMAAIARLTLSGNMITSSSRGFLRGEFTSHDGDLSGLISLCDALPALQNPIDLDLSDCGLSVSGVNPVVHAIQAGSVGAVSLSGCQLEPVMVAQVLSVASEVSRLRLRAAQVLAFCCALHDRMGADSAVCDMVDNGVVDIWQIVASMVRAQHGNEALRSTLACQNPWYEVCVRGLVPRRVPHWERRQ